MKANVISGESSNRLFEAFMMIWGDAFDRLPPIFRYIYSYKHQLTGWRFGDLVNPHFLISNQMAFLSSICMLDDFCQKYIKPFWIPMTDTHNLRIDLSNPNFLVFFLSIYGDELIGAHRKVLFNRIDDFLIALDNGTDGMAIDQMCNTVEVLRPIIPHSCEAIAPMDPAYLIGPTNWGEILLDDGSVPIFQTDPLSNSSQCSNISSLGFGLFPYHARIQVNAIDWLPGNLNEELESCPIRISELIKFIRAFGKQAITYLRLTFLPNNGLVVYRDGEFTSYNVQFSYKAHFVREYEQLLERNR